jgi:rubrerythrin
MLIKCLKCGYVGSDDEFNYRCPNCENETKFIALSDFD